MLAVSLLAAVAIRIFLFQIEIANSLMVSIAISTPLTSWNRVIEGVTYVQNGVPPYSGDSFHQTPLVLYFFCSLRNFNEGVCNIIFVVFDLGISCNLYYISKYILTAIVEKEVRNKGQYCKNHDSIIVSKNSITTIPTLVLLLYLLHPFSILTCVAKSIIVVNNFAITLAILLTLKDKGTAAMLALAIATYQSLYPFMLVIPLSMYLSRQSDDSDVKKQHSMFVKFSMNVATFLAWFVVLLLMSFVLLRSWDFVRSIYGFILSAPDMQPNLGLFWYFFTEMFDHFELFFLIVFQINAFFYLVPLAVRLRQDPVFLSYLLCLLIAIFKSYPSLGDLTFTLALLPVWSHLLKYSRNSYVIIGMLLSSTILAPILWHLWIYAGSANANFFYAVTLMHSTAQIFLIADLLYSYLVREHDLYRGVERNPELKRAVLSYVK